MNRNLLRFGLLCLVLLVSVVTKASDITLTYSLGTTTAEGTLPASATVEVGSSYTLPVNTTLYVAGSTLTGWTDGTNTYKPGETITAPIVGSPHEANTETLLRSGNFKTKKEVENLIKYLRSKTSRAVLGVLKVTQDITHIKFKYVPLQDFTPSADIDWSKSVHEIDLQLYDKYGLTAEERNFIETHVKEMD